jgi:transcriptional regulator with XRE-family HTH domain
VPKTPNRAKRTPHSEGRFPSQIVAANVRGLRALHDLSQDDLAEKMRHLRHNSWSRATVSEIEREDRSVTIDELASLAVVLNVGPGELFDPDRLGVHLDLGMTGPVRKNLASAWARRLLRITVEGDKYVFEQTLEHLADANRISEWLRMLAKEES